MQKVLAFFLFLVYNNMRNIMAVFLKDGEIERMELKSVSFRKRNA